MNKLNAVDSYIANFPKATQEILNKIRALILENAPNAIESVNYGMPAYKTDDKPLVYFAAYKNHIGFYATPSGHSQFESDLTKYKQGKGSVQFSLKQEIPFDLLARIVQFKLEENKSKS